MSDVIETEEVSSENVASPQKITATSRKVVPNHTETITSHEPVPKTFKKKKNLFRIYQIIWYALTVIEIILGFRVFLKFLGANPTSGFAHFIYTLSAPLAEPFSGIFQITPVSTNAVVEWSTFFAMGVYVLLAYILTELIPIIKPVSPEEVDHTIDIE